MINLLYHSPVPNDATAFYRTYGPLSRLHRDNPNYLIVQGNEFKEYTVSFFDLILLQRPFKPDHLRAAEIVLSCNVPLWVDYDDDLFSVPTDNPTQKVYGRDEIKRTVAKITAMADVVSVSTETLREKIAKLNKNIFVIPNALDDLRWERRRPRLSPRRKLVFWRGSATHVRDVLSVGKHFVEVTQSPEAADWKFNFMGENPWMLTDQMPEKQTLVVPPTNCEGYMKFLEELNPAIMVCPLINTGFNRAKSNIAWIEAMYTGAALLAPPLPEFTGRPGIVFYESGEDFGKKLLGMIRGDFDLEKINQEGWEYVKANATLSQINKERERLIEALTKFRPRGLMS